MWGKGCGCWRWRPTVPELQPRTVLISVLWLEQRPPLLASLSPDKLWNAARPCVPWSSVGVDVTSKTCPPRVLSAAIAPAKASTQAMMQPSLELCQR
ncbi:hypothetical protein J6590_077556 [Homalodisca vitripennis]|nr:hypothetical protein J6590_077556 [Homalodisca vitripennis]